MPKLPEVSGRQLAALLEGLGYVAVRSRGSHVQCALNTEAGRHTITVPMHRVVAKGTLADILKRVAVWTNRSVDELLARL